MTNHFENAKYYMALADLYEEEHAPWEEVVAETAVLVESFQKTIKTYEQGITAMLARKSGPSEFIDDVDLFSTLAYAPGSDRAVVYRILKRGAGNADAKSRVQAFQVAMHRLRATGKIEHVGHGGYRLIEEKKS